WWRRLPKCRASKAATSRHRAHLLLVHSAGIPLIGDHEHNDLERLGGAHVARYGVDRARRLIKDVAGLQDAGRLVIHPELVRPLDHVAEGVMTRMLVRRTAVAWSAVKQRDPHLASGQIGKRRREQLTVSTG